MNQFLSRLIIFALVVGALFWFFPDAERDKTGAIVSEGDLDVYSLEVNDCFNNKNFNNVTEEETERVTSVEAIPCSMPHDNEIYAISHDLFFQTTYPSDEELTKIVGKYCLSKFLEFVGINYEYSILDINYFYPLLEGWNNRSDRQVVCIIGTDKKLEGSLRGSGI